MELYYNPEQMPDAEIKQTFVGREPLLKELLNVVRRQPKGAGVQHVVLIGARGMGKTTMLLMLRFAVLDGDLHKKWQPVRFPEESYAITEMADFWLAAIRHLADETADSELAARGNALPKEFPAAAALADAALAVLRDWNRKHGKRLLLLVDNLDMVLDQIGDTTENARLRDALMNDGTFMLVGGATSFFHEARGYDQPLYNFFRTWNLDSLDSNQINQLLLRRAAADKRTGFAEHLRQNEARIRTLHYFTGGNPRLVLMLYRIIASSDLIDVQRGLEKLLDEVTPYYKAKIESLPPQQRKILDHIARVSARTRSGLTPTEIAAETRLPVNQVTSQLKRLSGLGYVRAANVRARSSWYSLAEPLYAIWHQMRFGREGRERMAWLVEFLKGWYTSREMFDEAERLAARFAELVTGEQKALALETLHYRQYLADAMDERYRGSAIDRLINDCLDAGDRDRARRLVQEAGVDMLRTPTLKRLRDGGLITPEAVAAKIARLDRWIDALKAPTETPQPETPQLETLVSLIDAGSDFLHQFPQMRLLRASLILKLGREDEANADLESARGYDPVEAATALLKAQLLARFGHRDEAINTLAQFGDELASNAEAQLLLASCYALLGHFDKAIAICGAGFETTNSSKFGELLPKIEELRDVFEDDLPVLFVLLAVLHAYDDARTFWKNCIAGILEPSTTLPYLAAVLVFDSRNLPFLRALMHEFQLEGEMPPLQAVMEYVETGDRSAIEKLSAEARPVAAEIVDEIEKRRGRGDRAIPSILGRLASHA